MDLHPKVVAKMQEWERWRDRIRLGDEVVVAEPSSTVFTSRVAGLLSTPSGTTAIISSKMDSKRGGLEYRLSALYPNEKEAAMGLLLLKIVATHKELSDLNAQVSQTRAKIDDLFRNAFESAA